VDIRLRAPSPLGDLAGDGDLDVRGAGERLGDGERDDLGGGDLAGDLERLGEAERERDREERRGLLLLLLLLLRLLLLYVGCFLSIPASQSNLNLLPSTV
jgi:hypothetical protein